MIERPFLFGATKYVCVATGTVKWLDVVPLTPNRELTRESYPSFLIDEQGVRGSKHYGLTRRVSVQDQLFYQGYEIQKGTMIANTRAWSAVSSEDLGVIQINMECPTPLRFGLLRENIGIEGLEEFSSYLPGTLLFFRKNKRVEVVLSVVSANNPCAIPAGIIAEELNFPDAKKLFPKSALKHRGLVGNVIKPGEIELKQSVDVIVPEALISFYGK